MNHLTHKIGCMATISCLVIHPDGVCPGPYGKCTCAEIKRTTMNETKQDGWELVSQVGRDMHRGTFTEALCSHEIGHHKGTHGCDGCCSTWPKYIADKVSEDEYTV